MPGQPVEPAPVRDETQAHWQPTARRWPAGGPRPRRACRLRGTRGLAGQCFELRCRIVNSPLSLAGCHGCIPSPSKGHAGVTSWQPGPNTCSAAVAGPGQSLRLGVPTASPGRRAQVWPPTRHGGVGVHQGGWRRDPPFHPPRGPLRRRHVLGGPTEAGSDSDDSDDSPAPAASAATAPAASARPGAGRRPSTATRAIGPRTRRRPRPLASSATAFVSSAYRTANGAPFAFGSCPLHDLADSE